MSEPIHIPKKGPKAWRRVAKEVSDRLEADKPVAGLNISIRETPSGRQITGTPGGADGRRLTTYFIRNGALVSYDILVASGPVTIE